ncbi:MAG: adenylate kinase [Anaerolineales bacterium]|nr:adenylate kinase [Anaerolineales bacterium]
MSVYLVLLGAPGAGKGTQAKHLMEALSLPHISSGNIFRENLNKQTELGKLAQTFISDGQLVPDDVTIAMIRERLEQDDCTMGAMLDGFPRTPTQAEALDVILADLGGELDAVLYIKVTQEILVRRLSGRWMCRAAGHVFHDEFNPPLVPGVCDYDGSELYQRDDDRAETVAERIRVYINQTAPLIDYYRQRGLLVEVDGDQSIEAVADTLMAALPEGAVQ